MSENDETFDPQGDGGDIKDLRRAAEEGKKAKQERDQLKRELAFAKAGIPDGDPRMTYFVKGYDGELEPEAIKSAAIEAGFLSPPAAEIQQQEANQQALSAQQRVASASAGAIPEDGTIEANIARLDEAYAQGGMESVFALAQQYGVGLETNEI